MNNMKLIILLNIILFVTFSLSIHSVSSAIDLDSLEVSMADMSSEKKIDALFTLSHYHYKEQNKRSIDYAIIALKLSKDLKSDKNIDKGYKTLAELYYSFGRSPHLIYSYQISRPKSGFKLDFNSYLVQLYKLPANTIIFSIKLLISFENMNKIYNCFRVIKINF